jgi:hypothetical protein
MDDENIKIILTILQDEISNNDYGEDNIKIEKLIKLLENLKVKLPNKDELEAIDKEITYLDQKYDVFNELLYYFGPINVKIEHEIHANEVKAIREEMRKKRNKQKH